MVRLTDLIRGAQDSPDDGDKKSGENQAGGTSRVPPIQLRNLPGNQTGAEDQSVQNDWIAAADQTLHGIADAIQRRLDVTLGELPTIATAFVTSLARDDRLLVRALARRGEASQVRNLINTAIYSVKVGMGMGYRREELLRLALAALVHDVGMFRLPEHLMNDPGRWGEPQLEIMRTHPTLGAELLHRAAQEHPWLPEVVLQEHERANGSGYPRGLKGYQTHEFAQIIGLCDVFDALLTVRPYRRRMQPHEAIRELLQVEKASFPGHVIKALVQEFSLFPLGTTVRLNTGAVGVVAKLNSRFPLRPVISVTDASDRGGLSEVKEVDLSKTTLVHIVEVVVSESAAESA